jgi:hypothetical protein
MVPSGALRNPALWVSPMWSLRQAFRARCGPACAERVIAGLPPYQVAFWPDGWELDAGGGVTIRDTHATAEARRWYRLAEGRRSRDGASRVMALHGIDVPRALVEMTGRRFPSETVVSVAVQLAAGEWVRQRRRQLQAAAEEALRDRALAWSGSRHTPGQDAVEIARLMGQLLSWVASEGLIPGARYRLRVSSGDGYGILSHRCRIEVGLDRYERQQVEEVLKVALVPWNRAVVRDGNPIPLIDLAVRAPQPANLGPSSGPRA